MNHRVFVCAVALAGAAALGSTSCSESTTSSPSTLPQMVGPVLGSDAESVAPLASASSAYASRDDVMGRSAETSDGATLGELTCAQLEKRSVRFSDPGFVERNLVGLFYNFEGVPAGPALIEVYWDEENAPDAVERVPLGEGEIQRGDDSKTDHTGVVQHAYPGIQRPTERRVRANLVVPGWSGNCATVRTVTVTPGEASTGTTSSKVEEGFSGSKTQLGRIFRDGVPSTCAGKAYPGIFNPGTTYNYETYRYKATGVGTVCVKVNFDPNPSTANPCGTNAHMSAYTASYDPANPSAGFLGDSGVSNTVSFEFPVPAGTSFDLVVTNTTTIEACDYTFTVENAAP